LPKEGSGVAEGVGGRNTDGNEFPIKLKRFSVAIWLRKPFLRKEKDGKIILSCKEVRFPSHVVDRKVKFPLGF